MVDYKVPKLFGVDDDGLYEARIEEIGTGWFSDEDTLYISNRRPDLWVLSLFNGYRQLGTFKVHKGHKYSERQDIIVEKKHGVIIRIVESDSLVLDFT